MSEPLQIYLKMLVLKVLKGPRGPKAILPTKKETKKNVHNVLKPNY